MKEAWKIYKEIPVEVRDPVEARELGVWRIGKHIQGLYPRFYRMFGGLIILVGCGSMALLFLNKPEM